MRTIRWTALFICALMAVHTGAAAHAAEVVFPQTRHAYHAAERIELAVAGLDQGAGATLRIAPVEGNPAEAVTLQIDGAAGAETLRLPPHALAPGAYEVSVDGQQKPVKLTVSTGLPDSTMYFSQTGSRHGTRESGANFSVSSAFNFGLLTRDGKPDTDVRRLSRGMEIQANLIAQDLPSLIYMYWTGYVLHKPWGIHKSWAADHMTRNMRRFNFHVAQRMRRFDDNVMMIGALDEPGLPWGKTPAGGSASGFPGWDTRAWYESRGWNFTNDPAGRSDENWLKYMDIRTSILGEQLGQARNDIHRVWPEAKFSSDLYAPHAIMDGTDPWNQRRANDIPSTHVFADYGLGKLGVLAGLYLEKAHDPLAKVAHAMNGQLFGGKMAHPRPLHAFQLMRNVLLAAGLESNWWLNYRALGDGEDAKGRTAHELTSANLRRINEPALRYGPVFDRMKPDEHEVAVLWSWTEIAMRCKPVTAQAAHAREGEQPSLMIPDLPEEAYNEQGERELNVYNVGNNYEEEITAATMGINRAGYPAHVLHERLLPTGALEDYKVLVIMGQTHALPDNARQAIEQFVADGGQVIVDEKTSIELPGALVTKASVAHHGHQWQARFRMLEQLEDGSPKTREASYFRTNHYMENVSREAAAAFKKTLQKTDARPVMTTDSVELACERHTAGEGSLVMIINGYEELPDIKKTDAYPLWNYAPYKTSYRLPTIGDDSAVYKIEGAEWDHVERVGKPTGVQNESFAAGEMKLYLVAPRVPKGLTVKARAESGALHIEAALRDVKMPWPLKVRLTGPKGIELTTLHRSTDADGTYHETLPIGRNVPAGAYTVRITSPVADLSGRSKVDWPTPELAPQAITEAARVFDGDAIRAFLGRRPNVTIALGDAAHRPVAKRLAAALREVGIAASIKSEGDVWRKARYPRVWDPYITVFKPTDDPEQRVDVSEDQIERRVTITSEFYDRPTVRTADGEPVEGRWRKPGTLATVTGKGFINIRGPEQFYEPGCKLFVQERRRLKVLNVEKTEVKATQAVREKWSRPWQRLHSYNGAHNLVPQLPEAYHINEHVILLGDSTRSELVRALQASELLPQVVDEKYPGHGKALVQFAWHPFTLGHHAIFIGATDHAGLDAGTDRLIEIAAGATK